VACAGLMAEEVESYGRAIEERDLARSAAICLEQDLTAANRQINAALANLEAADHCCCPCGAPGCGDSICNICRARLELGGSL
jgi:hypothetical protein